MREAARRLRATRRFENTESGSKVERTNELEGCISPPAGQTAEQRRVIPQRWMFWVTGLIGRMKTDRSK